MWVISDSLKLFVVVCLLVTSALQLLKHAKRRGSTQTRRSRGIGFRSRRRLQWANLVVGTIFTVWLADLHGLVGMGWRVFLGLSSLLVSVMMEEGLYIGYLVTYTSYARTRLSGGMSPVIGMCYFLVGLTYFLCQLASVLLTLRSDEFRWSLLRHASTTSLLLFISIYSGLLIYRLKREVGRLAGGIVATRPYPHDDYDYKSETRVNQQFLKLQAILTKILLTMLPVCAVGILSGVMLVIRTLQNEYGSYSRMFRRSQRTYSLPQDIEGYWSILLVHGFFVYYAYIPMCVQRRPSHIYKRMPSIDSSDPHNYNYNYSADHDTPMHSHAVGDWSVHQQQQHRHPQQQQPHYANDLQQQQQDLQQQGQQFYSESVADSTFQVVNYTPGQDSVGTMSTTNTQLPTNSYFLQQQQQQQQQQQVQQQLQHHDDGAYEEGEG